ncbi:ATP-dependent DNA ligase [Nocardioides sp.]|uniref:ATP-dependent DNA ligase n=1 Tax=Nocardioides sp. TaxID=35761 RepID=UPI0027362822|nr:ATP-dependent DNA ligase [Nocardioides sp.]MDP3893552.1 ATP-dependent DNA ligase [Nocardioides sp.]
MLINDLVSASRRVAATRSRKEKVAALAEALRAAGPADVAVVVSYLAGSLRQRRTGLGWRSLMDLPDPAPTPTLEVAEVDAVFEHIAALAGGGSRAAREEAVADLFGRATAPEQVWLRGLVTGELRQGALDALVQEAVATAAEVPVTAVRRAAMLAGATVPVAVAVLTEGPTALDSFRLEVGRPVLPMLASSAPDVAAALAKVGGQVAVDAKLDGIRIQVHRDRDDVRLATRTLEDITTRLPEVVEAVRRLPVDRVVLDGEVMLLGPDGRPRPFQETASRTASGSGAGVTPYFFDVLHLGDRSLLDDTAAERHERLVEVVGGELLVPRLVTDDAGSAQSFFDQVVADGHEGVVVKSLTSTYQAGRRGASWVKVKPVHTLDLVVLAVERGSGRRAGWLSNIHLGARDPATGDFVMLGKTFKGMTDEVLAWQTERFRELATSDDGHVVHVRPEQVVEIAFDGIQTSRRYPAGMALRFARVIRYRDDKGPEEADTVETVRSLLAT